MAKPIPYDYRVRLIKLRQSGRTYSSIAKEFGISERSIQRLWKRYQIEGESALKTKYHQSGRRSTYSSIIRDKIAEIRDGDQGAPYVRSQLLMKNAEEEIPHERTIQRWWLKQGINRPKGRPKSKSNWTEEPNHTWQIDGKEYIELAEEKEKVSWMKVADEATSSDLATRLFPHSPSDKH